MRRNMLITGASSGLGAGMARHGRAGTPPRVVRAARRAARGAGAELGPRTRASRSACTRSTSTTTTRCSPCSAGLPRSAGSTASSSTPASARAPRIGTGKFEANRETAETNFVAALAQCEAAMEHFYERKAGHLVVISSMSAMRGMPRRSRPTRRRRPASRIWPRASAPTYRRKGHDIKVTTLYPGYIALGDERARRAGRRLMVDTETGCRALVKAIETEVVERPSRRGRGPPRSSHEARTAQRRQPHVVGLNPVGAAPLQPGRVVPGREELGAALWPRSMSSAARPR